MWIKKWLAHLICHLTNGHTFCSLSYKFCMARNELHLLATGDSTRVNRQISARAVNLPDGQEEASPPAPDSQRQRKSKNKFTETVRPNFWPAFWVAVSIDEAQISFHPGSQKTDIFYGKRGEDAPQECVVGDKHQFPEKFMIVTGITGRGPLKVLRVPLKTKVNASLYVEEVLKKIVEEELPKMCPGEMHKVFIHHDKASSHTARITEQYLQSQKEQQGIRYLKKDEIPVKGADISPMDFFGFGYIKQKLKKKRPTTLEGLWKLVRETWARLPVDTPGLVMAAWKRRCRMVHKLSGEPIQHLKAIHRKNVWIKFKFPFVHS